MRRVAEDTARAEDQMLRPGGEQGPAGDGAIPLASGPHRQHAVGVQPFGEFAGEAFVHMLHDDHSRGKVARQGAEDFRERRRAAGRGAEENDRRGGREQAMRLRGFRWRRAAGELPNEIDLRQQGVAAGDIVQARGGHDVDCADAHRLKDASAVSLHRGRDHEDRTGMRVHDLPRGFDAIDVWHDHVHEHEVGRGGGASLDGLPAIASGPEHAVARIRGEHAADGLNGESGIVDDGDVHSGSPIKSRTALMSVRSWKLPLGR